MNRNTQAAPDFSVLYEDNHLLVVDKPAGIATMGSVSGERTIARLASSYLKQRYNKPGNAFVGVVSRLDRLVSGVLVLARTSKAASRLSEQFRNATVDKRYVALVAGKLQPSSAWQELTDWILKDESAQRMRVVPQAQAGALCARLRYRTLAASRSASLLEVELLTGRKHQIRLQLAEAGHPILGDSKYESNRKFSSGIALHCRQLTIEHPTQRHSMTFTSGTETHWPTIDGELAEALKRLSD
jgi:23S rRNA pseudouridine1911/1915/1917 synthase